MYILCQIFKLRKQGRKKKGRKEKAWRARKEKGRQKDSNFLFNRKVIKIHSVSVQFSSAQPSCGPTLATP